MSETKTVRHYYAMSYHPAAQINGQEYFVESVATHRFTSVKDREAWLNQMRHRRVPILSTHPRVRSLNRKRRDRVTPVVEDLLFEDH